MAALERHTPIIHERAIIGEDYVPATPVGRSQTGVSGLIGRYASTIGSVKINVAIGIQVQQRLQLAVCPSHDLKLSVRILRQLCARLELLRLGAGVGEPDRSRPGSRGRREGHCI